MLHGCCSTASLPGRLEWPLAVLSGEQDCDVGWRSSHSGPYAPPPKSIPANVFVEGVTIGIEEYALPADLRRYANIKTFGFLPLRLLYVDPYSSYGQQQRGRAPGKVMSDECSTAASRTPPPRRPFLPKLGNRGRAKLRGRIAAAAKRYSRELRTTMGIGSLNTATVAQLVDMADQLGLKDYVDSLSIEQCGRQKK
ncbi:hypothetical protein FOL47_001273 [Perkinsus chesapeaki]|uniref:Uncharacterized protein n=1 Tax=Perkinsus chesapeaki TaxID=330153 RepID=A0A7J6N0N0_PERCH|nr:hypothetical protein FOL47_001273 [Perkinsus chesapeaki]